MPRKTKDKTTENVEVLEPKKTTKVAKKSAKTAEKKETKTAKKSAKVTSKKDSKIAVSTKTTTKKATTKKAVAKKDASTNKKKTFLGEYYDLPNYYEQTIVKILAQTPTILFVYWNISDKDTKKLLKQYGENFFYDTYPILLVINKTKNYQFEVEINDYANSWYLHIPDSDCQYEVILMRKSKKQEEHNKFSITSSNQLETPNDHILFEKLGKTIFFKNVKNSDVQEKDISSFAFMHNIGRIYNIYDLYKEIYKDELNGDELSTTLPSS